MNKKLLMAALAIAGTGIPACAETKDIMLNDTSKVYDLDEVFVIRQPKDQARLRLQPVSASMFSAQEMDALGVRDMRELSAYVPNFVMPSYGSRYTSAIYMRGTGSRVNSPSVGIYVDGVPLMSKSAFNHHTYDLQRVDVMRGPQATLYGLNSEAGLIRLYTKNPMTYQGTDVKLSGGSHFYRKAEISNYNKLSQKLGYSLAAFYEGSNGFFKNTYSGKRADNYDEAGGRMKWVWRPTEKWNINILADYQYTRQQGAFPYGVLGDDGIAVNPSTNQQNNYRRNMLTSAIDLNYAANNFDFTSTTSYQYLKDYMAMDIDYSEADFLGMTQRQFQNSLTQEFAMKSRRPVGGVWNWTVGGFGSLSWLKTSSLVDFGQGMDSFLSSTIQRAMNAAIQRSMAATYIGKGMAEEEAYAQAAAAIERMGGISMVADMQGVPGIYRTPSYNLGFFHESSFIITPRLTATLGLRYDWQLNRIAYETSAAMTYEAHVLGQEALSGVTSMMEDRRHNHFDQLLPKVGLTYRIADNGSNIFATVSKGYRSGGFNIQMFSDIMQTELQASSRQMTMTPIEITHDEADYDGITETIAYKPETSWNYEVGTHLNLFGQKVQLDLGAFYMKIRNQQLSQMAGTYGFGRMMTNAGKSMSCGIEASLRGLALDDHLSWTASYGFTHAQFTEYTDSVTTNGVKAAIDYKDNKVPFVPAHTLAATIDYRIDMPLTSRLKSITVGANVNAQGKTYWDEANSMSQKLYAVAGAHVGFDMGKVKLNLWGRNLTDSRYNVFAVSSSATGTKNWFAQRGNPLQVGADLNIHF